MFHFEIYCPKCWSHNEWQEKTHLGIQSWGPAGNCNACNVCSYFSSPNDEAGKSLRFFFFFFKVSKKYILPHYHSILFLFVGTHPSVHSESKSSHKHPSRLPPLSRVTQSQLNEWKEKRLNELQDSVWVMKKLADISLSLGFFFYINCYPAILLT